jgi:hypothetical protein
MQSEFPVYFLSKKKFTPVRVEVPTFSNIKRAINGAFPSKIKASDSLIITRRTLGGNYTTKFNVIVSFENETLEAEDIILKLPECERCFLLLLVSFCVTGGKCPRLPRL